MEAMLETQVENKTGLSRGFRIFISIILALGVSYLWSIPIIWDANRSGGDNGSDPFGTAHILFLLISTPLVIIFSAKLIYRLIKQK